MGVLNVDTRAPAALAAASESGSVRWREGWVWAALVVSVFVVGSTEGLSMSHALDRMHLAAGWGIIGLAATAWLIHRHSGPFRIAGESAFGRMFGGTALEKTLTIGLITLALIMFLTAWICPPNTWDSETYHMARVAHWKQNRSVEFYPTHIARQLALSPFAEYAILHLQILLGSDRGANLVQWCAWIGSALVCSLIAARLGAGGLGQRLGAAVAMTIPSGVLQATGTYNDFVASLWICTFAYFVLRFSRFPDWTSVAGMAMSAGLAVLTKGTAFIFCLPFGIVALVVLFQAWRSKALLALGVIGGVVLLINGPFVIRLHRVYGTWEYSEKVEGMTLKNEVFDPPHLLSVLLRNVGMHVPFSFKGKLQQAFEGTHHMLGIDMNDPRTTFTSRPFLFERNLTSETFGQNPVHFVLIVIALVWALRPRVAADFDNLRPYAVCVVVGFVIFSVLLKWQTYHSRLQLPWFVLASPLVGLWWSNLRSTMLRYALVGVLLLSGEGPALANNARAWVGEPSLINRSRDDLYFAQCPGPLNRDYHGDYRQACEFVRSTGAHTVGLYFDFDDWEYPAWVLLANPGGSGSCRIEHVLVTNQSAILYEKQPWKDFVPECLLCARKTNAPSLQLGRWKYDQELSNSVFQVYRLNSLN